MASVRTSGDSQAAAGRDREDLFASVRRRPVSAAELRFVLRRFPLIRTLRIRFFGPTVLPGAPREQRAEDRHHKRPGGGRVRAGGVTGAGDGGTEAAGGGTRAGGGGTGAATTRGGETPRQPQAAAVAGSAPPAPSSPPAPVPAFPISDADVLDGSAIVRLLSLNTPLQIQQVAGTQVEYLSICNCGEFEVHQGLKTYMCDTITTWGRSIRHIEMHDPMPLADEFWKCVEGHPMLSKVTVYNCTHLTDGFLRHVAKCAALKEISIASCPNVSGGGFAELAVMCPGLEGMGAGRAHEGELTTEGDGAVRVNEPDGAVRTNEADGWGGAVRESGEAQAGAEGREAAGGRGGNLAPSFPNLSSLKIINCALDAHWLEMFAGQLPALRRLTVMACPDPLDRFFLTAARTAARLESVEIVDCEGVSDRGIVALLKGCPTINSLTLSGCDAGQGNGGDGGGEGGGGRRGGRGGGGVGGAGGGGSNGAARVTDESLRAVVVHGVGLRSLHLKWSPGFTGLQLARDVLGSVRPVLSAHESAPGDLRGRTHPPGAVVPQPAPHVLLWLPFLPSLSLTLSFHMVIPLLVTATACSTCACLASLPSEPFAHSILSNVSLPFSAARPQGDLRGMPSPAGLNLSNPGMPPLAAHLLLWLLFCSSLSLHFPPLSSHMPNPPSLTGRSQRRGSSHLSNPVMPPPAAHVLLWLPLTCPFFLPFLHTSSLSSPTGRSQRRGSFPSCSLAFSYLPCPPLFSNARCPPSLLSAHREISEAGLIPLVQSCHRLQHMCFSGFRATHLSDLLLHTIASHCPLLSTLSLRACNGVTTHGVVRVLQGPLVLIPPPSPTYVTASSTYHDLLSAQVHLYSTLAPPSPYAICSPPICHLLSPHMPSALPPYAICSPPICHLLSPHMPSALPPYAICSPPICHLLSPHMPSATPHMPSALPPYAICSPPICHLLSPHMPSALPPYAICSPPICHMLPPICHLLSPHMPSALPPYAICSPPICHLLSPHMPSALPPYAICSPPYAICSPPICHLLSPHMPSAPHKLKTPSRIPPYHQPDYCPDLNPRRTPPCPVLSSSPLSPPPPPSVLPPATPPPALPTPPPPLPCPLPPLPPPPPPHALLPPPSPRALPAPSPAPAPFPPCPAPAPSPPLPCSRSLPRLPCPRPLPPCPSPAPGPSPPHESPG
ncbi:unnamed protein product [Closterium sp. Naga37s-1]|nr:unnamed protein product [Closterium sp. Naga37s-1]